MNKFDGNFLICIIILIIALRPKRPLTGSPSLTFNKKKKHLNIHRYLKCDLFVNFDFIL